MKKKTRRSLEPKRTLKYKGSRARTPQRYLMCFMHTKSIGIIDLSSIDESALRVGDEWVPSNNWIYDMRDGDGDFYYIQTPRLCEEMCDMLFDDRPNWF